MDILKYTCSVKNRPQIDVYIFSVSIPADSVSKNSKIYTVFHSSTILTQKNIDYTEYRLNVLKGLHSLHVLHGIQTEVINIVNRVQ